MWQWYRKELLLQRPEVDVNRRIFAIVAVTKTIAPEKIQEAVVAGIDHIGENRSSRTMTKVESISPEVTWHLVAFAA